MNKLLNALNRAVNPNNLALTMTIFILCGMNAPKDENDNISAAEYGVINSVLAIDGNPFFVYDTTYYDKTWAIYFQPEMFDEITNKVGIPVSITDEELMDMSTPEIMKQVRSATYLSRPLNLNAQKLNKRLSAYR